MSNKLSWFQKFLIKFKHSIGLNLRLIGGKHWHYAYEFGADMSLFNRKLLCKCRHRSWIHRFPYRRQDRLCNKNDKFCQCQNFIPMDNLDWIEYANVHTEEINNFIRKDLFDYERVIMLGERTYLTTKESLCWVNEVRNLFRMNNKLYRGIRQGTEAKVYADNDLLSLEPSKLLHPSEATYEFGYFGDGPSQTALAILYDAIQDLPGAGAVALKYYHQFKTDFIAPADYSLGFTILQSQIKEWIFLQMCDKDGSSGGWVL